jgi:hypothetical protein
MPDPIYFAPLRVPLVDPRTGLMAREWYLFFQALWLRTGGTEAPTPDGTLLLASQPTPDDNEAAKVISAILQLPDQLSGLQAIVAELQKDVSSLTSQQIL